MRALVYHGPGQQAWAEASDPEIAEEGDVIVRVDPSPFATHRFGRDEFEQAYDIFGDAADHGALKVVLTREEEADQ
jgi:threonine dehydrogenase-like Zn-dependent dehydrogenase